MSSLKKQLKSIWRQGWPAENSCFRVKHTIFANAKLASESLVGKLVQKQIIWHQGENFVPPYNLY